MKRTTRRSIPAGLISLLTVVLPLYGCDLIKPKLAMTTEYQAVFLDNGQLFIGKLEGAGQPYPTLRNVYYVQSKLDPETKQASNVLIKRGQEWHRPDVMYLNAQHIIYIEPVMPDSRVAQLINETKTHPSPAEEPQR